MLDFSLVHSIAPYFGIPVQEAGEIIEKVKSETSHWRDVATKYGISRSEQELMQRAFRDK